MQKFYANVLGINKLVLRKFEFIENYGGFTKTSYTIAIYCSIKRDNIIISDEVTGKIWCNVVKKCLTAHDWL